MQVPPRTPKDRAAVAQWTHHPANSALKRRAAPSTQALRTTTSKTASKSIYLVNDPKESAKRILKVVGQNNAAEIADQLKQLLVS